MIESLPHLKYLTILC